MIYKGLFWIVSGYRAEVIDGGLPFAVISYKIPCDAHGAGGGNASGGSTTDGDAIAHKLKWFEVTQGLPKEIRGGDPTPSWSSFPRGRVEISGGKAKVFYQPDLANLPGFEEKIAGEFGLREIETKFIADNSAHYRYEEGFMAPPPCVGLFFAVKNDRSKTDEIIISKMTLSEAEVYGDFRLHPLSHYDAWRRRLGGRKYGVDFDYYPRGRIAYDAGKRKFLVYVDRCLSESDINEILALVNLDNKGYEYEVAFDEHYQCHLCNNDYVR